MDATKIAIADGTELVVVGVLDDHARFLLAAVVCEEPTCEATWEAFVMAARRHGLPRQVLTDNHLSFTGRLHGVEVDFERRLRAIGVGLINGAPRHPQTQGKIERFHGTLKDWVAEHGGAAAADHLKALLEAFTHDYNLHRPHQALADLTPSERYRASAIAFSDRAGIDIDYGPDAIVRRADRWGAINFGGMKISLGTRWAKHLLRVIDDGTIVSVFHDDDLVRSLVPDRSQWWQPLRSKASR
jgi:hypothetical protein